MSAAGVSSRQPNAEGASLCYGVNVIQFGSTSNVFDAKNTVTRISDDALPAPSGWVSLDLARCPPWRAKRRRVVPGSREATRDTRRAEGAKGDPKGASERGVQSYGRPVCSRNELAMLWRNAG